MGELFKAVWTGATDTIQGITSAINIVTKILVKEKTRSMTCS